jgi:crotonobetainyl-CoA:carnitine CoA-transferase CaiB-like acyl-CoA transferase
LDGVRVVEIGTFQAGPPVGAHLATLGADVVRVESVRNPDVVRFVGAPPTVNRRRDRVTGDKAGRPRQFARNFQFFGAPVGLFC